MQADDSRDRELLLLAPAQRQTWLGHAQQDGSILREGRECERTSGSSPQNFTFSRVAASLAAELACSAARSAGV